MTGPTKICRYRVSPRNMLIATITSGVVGHPAPGIEGARMTRCTGRGGPLHTGPALLADKQPARFEALFAAEEQAEAEAAWGVYQGIPGAYRHPDGARRVELMQAVIDA